MLEQLFTELRTSKCSVNTFWWCRHATGIFTLWRKKKVLVCQLCLTLCNPMDCSSPGSSAHGILQARILEWVAIPFSGGSSQLRDQIRVSCIASRFFTIWATREGDSIPRNRNSQVMQWWRTRLPMQETWDVGSIPRSGKSPGEKNGNPLQYSCLGNPKDRGTCGATIHGVTKDPQLNNWTTTKQRWSFTEKLY